MKTIRTTCRNCHGRMTLEEHGAYYRLSCPFCGSAEILMGNDRVQVAQIEADTDRLGMAYRHLEHLDYLEEAHTRRRIQIAIICAFALIALVLTWIFMTQVC